MFTYTFLAFFVVVVVFQQNIYFYFIFISFFDKVSNLRNRILTNQKPKLEIGDCHWNCIYYYAMTEPIYSETFFLKKSVYMNLIY